MFCSNCGMPFNSNQKFCANCGAHIYPVKTHSPKQKKKTSIKWLLIFLPFLLVIIGSIIIITSSKEPVPVEYVPDVPGHMILNLEENEQLQSVLDEGANLIQKSDFELHSILMAPTIEGIPNPMGDSAVVYRIEHIYLDSGSKGDRQEEQILADASQLHSALYTIHARIDNRNEFFHPWILIYVHHPEKGLGYSLFSTGDYPAQIVYGELTEEDLMY